jgi:hypothetical protein
LWNRGGQGIGCGLLLRGRRRWARCRCGRFCRLRWWSRSCCRRAGAVAALCGGSVISGALGLVLLARWSVPVLVGGVSVACGAGRGRFVAAAVSCGGQVCGRVVVFRRVVGCLGWVCGRRGVSGQAGKTNSVSGLRFSGWFPMGAALAVPACPVPCPGGGLGAVVGFLSGFLLLAFPFRSQMCGGGVVLVCGRCGGGSGWGRRAGWSGLQVGGRVKKARWRGGWLVGRSGCWVGGLGCRLMGQAGLRGRPLRRACWVGRQARGRRAGGRGGVPPTLPRLLLPPRPFFFPPLSSLHFPFSLPAAKNK